METTQCPGCSEDKLPNEFGKHTARKGEKRRLCKPCHNEATRKSASRPEAKAARAAADVARRSINREHKWAVLCKSMCVDCGESNPIMLDFDHIDPSTKRKDVSQCISDDTLSSLQVEMAKCEVRCANCHRAKTARDLGYYKHGVNWSDPVVAEKYSKPWLTMPRKRV